MDDNVKLDVGDVAEKLFFLMSLLLRRLLRTCCRCRRYSRRLLLDESDFVVVVGPVAVMSMKSTHMLDLL